MLANVKTQGVSCLDNFKNTLKHTRQSSDIDESTETKSDENKVRSEYPPPQPIRNTEFCEQSLLVKLVWLLFCVGSTQGLQLR